MRLALLAALLLPPFGLAAAAPAKDYAYVFVQGRIGDAYGKHPVADATVRLTSDTGAFEATTDRKGVFVFERLPVATFSLDVVTADGRRMLWSKEPDRSDPAVPRVKLKFGKTRGKSTVGLVAHEAEQKVDLVVTDTPARWGRFWKQFAIFGAAALLLAL